MTRPCRRAGQPLPVALRFLRFASLAFAHFNCLTNRLQAIERRSARVFFIPACLVCLLGLPIVNFSGGEEHGDTCAEAT